jgi:hypothetical protein
VIENPWINIIACTTPSWIAGNFPEYMIGGGFTSRCLFVYAEEKARYVAYPGLVIPPDFAERQRRLVHDLEYISTKLCGPYELTKDAVKWGESWYTTHYTSQHPGLDDDRFGGYIARKQTHIHKLAMILSASQRDERTINVDDLETANEMVTDLEKQMPQVFSRIGRTDISFHAERLMDHIRRRGGKVPWTEAYRYVHTNFPSNKEFEDVVRGLVQSGQVRLFQEASTIYLEACSSS